MYFCVENKRIKLIVTMLDRYLDEIGKFESLTDEEEKTLSARIADGDRTAVDALVAANLRFVVSVASRYKGAGLDVSDLVCEGNIALVRAAERFDAGRGSRFISYAAPFVHRAIEKAIAGQSGLYSIPKGEDSPLEKKRSRALAADAPLGGRRNVSLINVLEDPDAPAADGEAGRQALYDMICESMECLNGRERQVITLFFGIGCDKMTFAEIGEEMGLKRERVRQIRNKALYKLTKRKELSL